MGIPKPENTDSVEPISDRPFHGPHPWLLNAQLVTAEQCKTQQTPWRQIDATTWLWGKPPPPLSHRMQLDILVIFLPRMLLNSWFPHPLPFKKIMNSMLIKNNAHKTLFYIINIIPVNTPATCITGVSTGMILSQNLTLSNPNAKGLIPILACPG